MRGRSARRAGFAVSVVAGLSMIGVSIGGMATLDEHLAAAARPPAQERVHVDGCDVTLPARSGDCPATAGDREQRQQPSRPSPDPA